MTTKEQENMKITGFKTVEEFVAYEKGYYDCQKVIMDFLNKWDFSTKTAFGKAFMKKYQEYNEKNL